MKEHLTNPLQLLIWGSVACLSTSSSSDSYQRLGKRELVLKDHAGVLSLQRVTYGPRYIGRGIVSLFPLSPLSLQLLRSAGEFCLSMGGWGWWSSIACCLARWMPSLVMSPSRCTWAVKELLFSPSPPLSLSCRSCYDNISKKRLLLSYQSSCWHLLQLQPSCQFTSFIWRCEPL